MLAYFPEILEDELLYSAFARLGGHRGLATASQLMDDLFGRGHAVATFDLPGGIGALARRLDPATGLDAEAIIGRTTLFNFHAAFVSPEVRMGVRRAMVESSVGVHLRLGIAASRVPPVRALRYCPACVAAMSADGGERYWRRAHQLPGIVVCPDHGERLVRSDVVAGRTRRHGFVSADEAIGGAPVAAAPIPGPVRARLQQLSVAAAGLLHGGMPGRDPAETSELYRSRLASVGLANGAKVDQAGLRDAFLAHWGAALHHVPGLAPGEAGDDGWLASLVRPRPRAAHPVQHLLLRLFLDARGAVEPPFGHGPWPCRNPLVPHVGEPVVASLRIRRDRAVLYGDFTCGCGYVYTRRVDPDGRVGPPRYRTFGPALAPAIAAAVAAGEGLRPLSRRVGLDPKTLMREAGLAGIPTSWRLSPSGTTERRAPPRRTAAAGQRAGRVRRHGGRARDWSVADRRIARAVAAEAMALRSTLPPQRVTFVELERRLAAPAWIRDRRAKLPLTVERINAHVEGTEAFRRRRLEWTVSEAMDEVGGVSASEILRRAGLPAAWMPRVRAAQRASRGAGEAEG